MSDNEEAGDEEVELGGASAEPAVPTSKLFDDDDLEIHQGEAGSSETEPRQCSSLRKNGFVMLKGRPCKIVEMTTSKTGKHGHAKAHLVGIDIFTGKKYEELCGSTHNMDVPYVSRREFELTNLSDEGFLELMADDGTLKDDVRVPDGELGDEIRTRFDNGEMLIITIIRAVGQEAAMQIRNATGDNKK